MTPDVRDALLERLRTWLGTDPDGSPRLATDATGRLAMPRSSPTWTAALPTAHRAEGQGVDRRHCRAGSLLRRRLVLELHRPAGCARRRAALTAGAARRRLAHDDASTAPAARRRTGGALHVAWRSTGEKAIAERIDTRRLSSAPAGRAPEHELHAPRTRPPSTNPARPCRPGRRRPSRPRVCRSCDRAAAACAVDTGAHIQGSWLTTGKEVGQLSLHYGADDLGSIMLEENVVSSAGAKHRSNRLQIIDLIRKAGRVPAQRATTYEHLVVHDDPANPRPSTSASSPTSRPRRSTAVRAPRAELLASN
ncbi:Cyclic dehypoxanthine futalosine synthase [Streptomyces tendae]